jgi:hypothetical protein
VTSPGERRTLGWSLALAIVVACGAVAAVLLHRNGHALGDDFALYLRQARSIFDGDIAQVVADNRFTLVNSGVAFSPYAYPWGFPLLLSPFVKWWGLDYDRLKLIEVACFCVWVVLVHGIVRRRVGRLLALVIAAGAVAYNVRRESVVLIAAMLVVQLVELVDQWRRTRRLRVRWQTLATPHLAMVGAIVAFQLLLPSMLIPDSGDGPRYIPARIGDWAGVLTQQLGIGRHPAIGALLLVLAAVGVVVGCVRRPQLDVPLAAVALLSVATVSTHFRMVGRYYFQVLPWVLYFAAVAILAGVRLVRSAPVRRLAPAIAAVPLVYLVAVHAVMLPQHIGDARDFNRGGRQQVGPTDPNTTPIFDAVEQHTPPDAVIAYFRARTMTLLTDRRAFQTTNFPRILQRADYFAQQRNSSYFQPNVTEREAREAGLIEVWSNERWVLWRVPDQGPLSDP